MTQNAVDYLIVAMDYATTCAGTCPTCVLTKDERSLKEAASTVKAVSRGLKTAAEEYAHIGTLAIGIGRANVLSLPETSIKDIVKILNCAKQVFPFEKIMCEVSTSLIGKIDNQITRAQRISQETSKIGVETKFVVVGNTALVSEKYWKNLDQFLRAMEEFRGGRDIDDNGDILQLALSSDSLPDPEVLAQRVKDYRFPINIAWAPGHDRGARNEKNLAKIGEWLGQFYDASQIFNLDCSLNNRVDTVMSLRTNNIPSAVEQTIQSSKSIVYIDQEGEWHHGLFTVLAEMDPVRFDPIRSGKTMIGISPKEIRSLITNEACKQCPFVGPCISSGGHKIAQITLRNYLNGTTVCPSGLRGCFERSEQREISGKN